MAKVFISYSHRDENLCKELCEHLVPLQRQNLISTWYDRAITHGSDFDNEINQNLEDSDIVLLLVSPSFLASNYCYEKEVQRAMDRHSRGQTWVIPIILRPCDWQGLSFGHLLAAPTDGQAVSTFLDRDTAFLQVVKAIKKAIHKSKSAQSIQNLQSPNKPVEHSHITAPQPDDSRLSPAPQTLSPTIQSFPPNQSRTAANSRESRTYSLFGKTSFHREFSDLEKDEFLLDSFSEIKANFQIALDAIQDSNKGFLGKLRDADADNFIATLYKNGQESASCRISISNTFGMSRQISFGHGKNPRSNGINEWFSVVDGGQRLGFKSANFSSLGSRRHDENILTVAEVGEKLWDLFLIAFLNWLADSSSHG